LLRFAQCGHYRTSASSVTLAKSGIDITQLARTYDPERDGVACVGGAKALEKLVAVPDGALAQPNDRVAKEEAGPLGRAAGHHLDHQQARLLPFPDVLSEVIRQGNLLGADPEVAATDAT